MGGTTCSPLALRLVATRAPTRAACLRELEGGDRNRAGAEVGLLVRVLWWLGGRVSSGMASGIWMVDRGLGGRTLVSIKDAIESKMHPAGWRAFTRCVRLCNRAGSRHWRGEHGEAEAGSAQRQVH